MYANIRVVCIVFLRIRKYSYLFLILRLRNMEEVIRRNAIRKLFWTLNTNLCDTKKCATYVVFFLPVRINAHHCLFVMRSRVRPILFYINIVGAKWPNTSTRPKIRSFALTKKMFTNKCDAKKCDTKRIRIRRKKSMRIFAYAKCDTIFFLERFFGAWRHAVTWAVLWRRPLLVTR